jgi:hypothetical protein
MGVLLSLIASCQLIADSAGARPDHPISSHGFGVREKGHVTPFTANECANYFTNAGYAST